MAHDSLLWAGLFFLYAAQRIAVCAVRVLKVLSYQPGIKFIKSLNVQIRCIPRMAYDSLLNET